MRDSTTCVTPTRSYYSPVFLYTSGKPMPKRGKQTKSHDRRGNGTFHFLVVLVIHTPHGFFYGTFAYLFHGVAGFGGSSGVCVGEVRLWVYSGSFPRLPLPFIFTLWTSGFWFLVSGTLFLIYYVPPYDFSNDRDDKFRYCVNQTLVQVNSITGIILALWRCSGPTPPGGAKAAIFPLKC